MDKELSIELSYEELKHVIKQLKFDIIVSEFHTSICAQLEITVNVLFHMFVFLANDYVKGQFIFKKAKTPLIGSSQKEDEHMKSTYTENSESMLKYVYDCVFFVAQKPSDCYQQTEPDSGRS